MPSDLTRPIIGIENRTAQEVFDIMCDRFRMSEAEAEALSRTGAVKDAEAARDALRELSNVKMDLSLEDWCRISNTILSALEPAAPEGQQEAARIGDAVLAWMTKYDLLDGEQEYYVADVIAVLDGLTPPARPSEQAVTEAAMSEAEEMFADYFRRNYPGTDTIIGKPDWHSPKIFRAALHALRSVDALKAAMEAGRHE